MTKKVIYKITKQKYEIIEVNTPEEEKIIEELNRDFERTEKANQRYRARCLSLDELYETQGFELADDSQSDDEDDVAQEKFFENLHKAIDTLTEKQKLVIYKTFWENKSLREIGADMDVNFKTVYEILEAAKKKIKKFLRNL